MAERDEARGGRRPGQEPAEPVVAPEAGGLEPDYEIVPVWVLPAIVIGLATASGSMVLLALLSVGTITWTILTADRTPPPRRPRKRP
ncbi:hypothetical protein [Pseudonocardia humida]|uniref:Uncharacterized protein n=1 Tax=Pseudonocardia humida TaxID=2800819 RepID=A0ABT0ZTR8_9PSEU|nr:hypothetical protein [Pseudonocardia humida]MCO1654118.1 hypothetical protein [Pseudonocardia humida]